MEKPLYILRENLSRFRLRQPGAERNRPSRFF